MRSAATRKRPSASAANCSATSSETELRSILSRLAELVRGKLHTPHVTERRFVLGNRAAERRQRSRQQFDTIEIGTQRINGAIELALHAFGCVVHSHHMPRAGSSVVRRACFRHRFEKRHGAAMVPVLRSLKSMAWVENAQGCEGSTAPGFIRKI